MKVQDNFTELLLKADEVANKKIMDKGLSKQQIKIAGILKDIQITISRHMSRIQEINNPVYMNIFLENSYSDSMYLEVLFFNKNTSYTINILSFVNDAKEEVISLDMVKRTAYKTESIYNLNDLLEQIYKEFN